MILLYLLILLATCGAAHGTPCGRICGLRPMPYTVSRVVGGVDVQPGTGAWAGIVSIQGYWSPNWSSHVCGGTLIRPQWVLSAAHCFINRTNPLSEWAVVAGAIVTNEKGPGVQVRRIKQVRIHELYDYTRELNDIALLELEYPITCTPTIQLACLPRPTVRVSELQNCYIAGWGHTYAKTQAPPGVILQEAKVLLIETQLCNSSDWNAGLLQVYHLCAGYPEGGVTTCQGDSGGPLICKDKNADYFWQVGLTSWGIGCARPKKPAVSVSTQFFYNWIMEQTSQSTAVAVTTKPAPASPVQTPTQPCPFPQKKLLQFFNLLQELLKVLRAKMA